MRPAFPFLDHHGVLAFAHRGGGKTWPENTMRAFAGAIALGYRYAETDIRVTRDGVPVLFHDATLDRVTGDKGFIGARDFAALDGVRVGGGERIPKLEDLLGAWPDLKVVLDIKEESAIVPALEAVKRTNAGHRVCVGCLTTARMRQARAAFGSRICTSASPGEIRALWLASRFGRTVEMVHAACAQVPERFGLLLLADKHFVRAAQRSGVQTHVWTVDEPLAMNRLLDRGVQGLMTDRPEVLKQVLEQRGLWH